jgi:hypothetical protein
MQYKILISLLFLSITSLLWSQENLPPLFEKKLISDIHEILFKTVEEKLIKRGDNTNEFMGPVNKDTGIKYNLIRTGIINKAHNYLGVRYHYGQSSEKGFDCSGFVKFVFRNFGLELPHSSYTLYKISKPVETAKAQSGDLVFFITRGKSVSHVGIYLGNNQFIHSPGRGRSVSIDSLSSDYYKRHLAGFGSVL